MLRDQFAAARNENATVEDPVAITFGQARHHPHAALLGDGREPYTALSWNGLGEFPRIGPRPTKIQAFRQHHGVASRIRSTLNHGYGPAKVRFNRPAFHSYLAHADFHISPESIVTARF